MMDYRKDLLLTAAARLYALGLDLEGAWARLKDLAEQGVSYDSDEMKEAYRAFTELHEQWTAPEAQYLQLRREILQGK